MVSRKGYYANIDIQYELIHQHKHKETFFLPYNQHLESRPPIRWLNASALKFMKKHWDRYEFLEKDMNLYHSLATYKDFPVFSYSWRVKSEQQRIWLKEFHKYLLKYDLFIETDSPDIEKAHYQTLKISEFLDKYLKYYVKFSGSKGFHFIIPYEEFEFLKLPVYDEKIEKKSGNFKFWIRNFPMEREQLSQFTDLVMLFKIIAWRLSLILGCDTIDTSVQDVKRVVKTAYSYDVKSKLIAYPLSNEQLINFKKTNVTADNVLKQNNHKRGLLWRNAGVSKEQREKNVLEMLKTLDILK